VGSAPVCAEGCVRQDTQERQQDFEFYMGLAPEKSRHFIENKIISLAYSMFMEAQWMEMLRNKLLG
jgi:hypothetical protein